MSISSSLILAISLWAADPETPLVAVPDPQAVLRTETADQTAARHAKVASAREGTAIILHRGAWDYAPENTLSAIRAGFELGANGVELDFRRTKDGVIVLFHDDGIERLLDGVGHVEQLYYEELLLYTFHSLPGPAAKTERVPTLRDVLQLVRDHDGLLHLDIKKPGIDDELLQELRNADLLAHVVTYNNYNSDAFRGAAVPKLRFKGSLMGNGSDAQPGEAEKLLQRPGRMVILDDPRALLTVMGKPPVRILPTLPSPLATRPAPSREELARLAVALRGAAPQVPVRLAAVRLANYTPARFCELALDLCGHPNQETRRAVAWNLGMIAKHRPDLISDALRAALVQLLTDRECDVRSEAAVACGRAQVEAAVTMMVRLLNDRPEGLDRWEQDASRQQERRALVEARARYAFGLGLLGVKSPEVTEVLLAAVKHRAVHRDVMLLGLDGAMAAWALGKLRTAESVDGLTEALLRDDPSLEKVRRASGYRGDPNLPSRWWDFNMHAFILPALAEIGSDEALRVLETALDPAKRIVHPYRRVFGADALLNARAADRLSICARLLDHDAPEVRRSAILTCLKRAAPDYRNLLQTAAPWALPWWDVQHRRGDK